MNRFSGRCILIATLTLIVISGVWTSTSYGERTGIGGLNNPSLARLPTTEEMAFDPLSDVAEAVRKRIDPSLSDKWPEGFRSEYVEHIIGIHDNYSEFWKRIPRESRRLVDLNNNGFEEYVLFSEGMNDDAWGFLNFVAVLGRPIDDYENTSKWELLHLQIIPEGIETYSEGILKWTEFELAFTDQDRDGRTDVLYTMTQVGGSSSSRYLNVVSFHPDMQIRHHQLTSAEPIHVLKVDALRPVFVQHHYDDWVANDVGASVRGRGYRRAYFTWNVCDGFVRF